MTHMDRKSEARQKVIDIFNDSAAMPGNEVVFNEALQDYTAAVVEATIESVQMFRDAAEDS